ncbi:transglycosylase SLT domain-containing protein [Psychroflexus salis]|uniref:Lytic transglycosylase F n=1 Tax=Psychroflexus salis TaxID=1526574 RepID=A0A916ZXB0_9FLAO|nr:transporter substrate-binding domain-containing protein [Psychroflexus salis]GGE17297.1 lytic transglycosylase F [Psychroflexus salis]
MKYIYLLFLGILMSCSSSPEKSKKNIEQNELIPVEVDLAEIKKRGKLKALTTYSGTTYFLYKGKTMGFEYELLERLCKKLDVGLEMVIAQDENELMDMLIRGEGDIIAYGYTILNDRQTKIQFTDPLYLSNQVLVQRKPANWRRMKLHQIEEQMVTDPIQLIGDTVSVKQNSSYASRLANLNKELGGEIYIDTIPGTLTTEEIIAMVANGKLKYTVVDQNIGYINASNYSNLDISTKISFTQQIAWGVRKNSPELLKEVNNWITSFSKTTDYHVIYNKYYKNKRRYKARVKSEFYSIGDNKISPYDELIKKYAEKIGWDWRLVASIAYQESQFKPQSKSWAGARGLMQIMPATAESLKITDPTDPQESLRGGTAYLTEVWGKHEDITDSIQRIKFTLASYNCGYAHLKDAQRIAERKGLHPKIWDNNVELAILDLSSPKYYNSEGIRYGYVRGTEPYNYVRQIFERYEHYTTFIKK